MSVKTERFILDEHSDKLIDDIVEPIKYYSTPLLLKNKGSNGEEDIRLIGSGTFASILNIFGIITAAHVVEILIKEKSIARPYSLGLIIKDYKHNYSIPSNYLELIKIAKGQIDSDGPDLGFIVLPNSEVGTIKATKNFHNLDKNRERILATPPKFNAGPWAICGVPDEKTIDELSEEKSILNKRFFMFCGVGSILNAYTVGEYDYYDIRVKHDLSPIIPHSFGGVSGGGLWQIPLRKSAEQKVEPIEYILSGVAFYQTERTGLYRSVRCHGRNSIYDMAYSFIAQKRKTKTENYLSA